MQQLPLGVRWRDSSVFSTFVADGNSLAVDALTTWNAQRNPVIWLWGAPGTGKSHLLQAACALEGGRGAASAFFPLHERAQFGSDALSGCEQLPLVCLDDVDQVAGDLAWNRALFVLHNGLLEQHGRLLLSASDAPAGLAWALPDLASRMAGALVIQLRALDEMGQVQVLRLRARRRGLDLPDEVAQYLLRRVPRDLRTLCNLLDTLDTASLASQRRLTVPFIRQILGPG
jgi:DnaA-homolog protein